MARHNPGDAPSVNVRTAPTPSEPNTPVAAASSASTVEGTVPLPGPELMVQPQEEQQTQPQRQQQEEQVSPYG